MIHAIRLGDAVEIWTDTEVATCDGRCIGTGATFDDAKAQAINELADELRAVCKLTPADATEAE